MAWLFAGAALAALTFFASRGFRQLSALLVLAGGALLALHVYPPLAVLALCGAGIAAGFLAMRLADLRLGWSLGLAGLAAAAAFLLFASLGPADGLF